MAKLIKVVDNLEKHSLERRQLYLEVDESSFQNITMVVQFEDMCNSCMPTNEKDRKEFIARCKNLGQQELMQALRVPHRELFQNASQLVPCVGCRQSAERLYEQLSSTQHFALSPLRVSTDKDLFLESGVVSQPERLYKLLSVNGAELSQLVQNIPRSRKNKRCPLHSMDTHKPKFNNCWSEVWKAMSGDCKKEMLIVDGEALLETVEAYLRKHRFCPECKSRVLKAYDIVVGDVEGKSEEGFNSNLYAGIRACVTKHSSHHIHVTVNTQFVARLVAKAEPDILGNRRERHAKTLDIAQEEILTCIGIHLFERLHKVWQKLKVEEQAGQIVLCLGLRSLQHKFQLAIERKQGISDFERTCQLMWEEQEEQAARQEQRRLKKKQKRKNKAREAASAQCIDCTPAPVTSDCQMSPQEAQDSNTQTTASSCDTADCVVECDARGLCHSTEHDEGSPLCDGGYSSGAERDVDSCYSSLADTCSLQSSLGSDDRNSLDGDALISSTDQTLTASAPDLNCELGMSVTGDTSWSTLSSLLEKSCDGPCLTSEGTDIPHEAIRSYHDNKFELTRQRQMLRQRLQQKFNSLLSKR